MQNSMNICLMLSHVEPSHSLIAHLFNRIIYNLVVCTFSVYNVYLPRSWPHWRTWCALCPRSIVAPPSPHSTGPTCSRRSATTFTPVPRQRPLSTPSLAPFLSLHLQPAPTTDEPAPLHLPDPPSASGPHPRAPSPALPAYIHNTFHLVPVMLAFYFFLSVFSC